VARSGVGPEKATGLRVQTSAFTGAVVTRDVNDYEIVGGVPAKRVGSRVERS